MLQDLPYLYTLGDERNQAHVAATHGTHQREHLVDACDQHRPQVVRREAFGRLGCWCLGRRRGHDSTTERIARLRRARRVGVRAALPGRCLDGCRLMRRQGPHCNPQWRVRCQHPVIPVTVAVLVNDYCALNIDAELIQANAGATVALTIGCVCCQIGDDLTLALIRVLDAGVAFDAVVVEASGVCDPWRIARMGRADLRLLLDGVVVLVNAGAVLEQSCDPLLLDTLERQLKAADLIVVNKRDLVTDAEHQRISDRIDLAAAGVARFETTYAVVPLPMLSGLALPEANQCRAHGDTCGVHEHDRGPTHRLDHGALFDTWSCRPRRAFAPDALRAWLCTMPPGVLRLKGVLRAAPLDCPKQRRRPLTRGSGRTMPMPKTGAGFHCRLLRNCSRHNRSSSFATTGDGAPTRVDLPLW